MMPLVFQLECNDELGLCQEGVPSGYEAVSLIEALNGPPLPQCALSATVMPSDGTIQSLSSAESPRGNIPCPRNSLIIVQTKSSFTELLILLLLSSVRCARS
jgi:hypothetical protein